MPQSLAKIITHIIFSTKNRQPIILPEVRDELTRYLAGALKELKCPSIEINCVSDHVHVLCCLSKTMSMADLVEEIKKSSSRWIKGKSPFLADFYWQNGYGAFSVSQSNVPDVRAYIAAQEKHHQKVSFQDEFRAFLKKHGMEFNERHLWD